MASNFLPKVDEAFLKEQVATLDARVRELEVEKVNSVAVHGRTRLHSRRADVATLLASADVALAPGPHETFGLAALEALKKTLLHQAFSGNL